MSSVTLDFVPYEPAHLLALIEAPQAFADLVGVPAAAGLREFLVGGEVPASFVERLRAGAGADPWWWGFAVVHRAARLVIGNASYKGPPDADGAVEIAYAIVPAYRGQGHATTAAGMLVDYAVADPRVRRLRAHTLPARNASTRVLEKNGFRLCGEVVDPDDGRIWRWER